MTEKTNLKVELILAGVETSPFTYGIGFNDALPWNCPADLLHFKNLTLESTLIVGRKTYEKISHLKQRSFLPVSKSNSNPPFQNLERLDTSKIETKIFVAGGGEIYKWFLDRPETISKIHLSIVKTVEKDQKFDTFVEIPRSWVISSVQEFESFTYYTLVYSPAENAYMKILEDASKSSVRSTRNSTTSSVFFRTMSFDLRDGFPLLTTKKMFFRGIVEELLFFLRGQTDTKILEDLGVKIWKGNTSRKFLDSIGQKNRREGVMGPMYGYQWRYFNAKYDEESSGPAGPLRSNGSDVGGESKQGKGIDQLENCINLIKNDPTSRRILLTTFNPEQAELGVLYPCHSLIIQFYVGFENGIAKYLDMSCYNRSQDLFLGTPFNIASSASLLSILAGITKLVPRHLHMILGDCHVYTDHLPSVELQLKRRPYKFPRMTVKSVNTLKELENLEVDDFCLMDYSSYDSIKANMVA